MLKHIWDYLRSLVSPHPVRLAVVRRYADANGNYVGELYLEQVTARRHDTITGYVMIGVSLDSLPLNADGQTFDASGMLDTQRDFLAPMPLGRLRVGAIDPLDNDNVRYLIDQLPCRNMTVTVQNRFIEHIMEGRI